MGSVTSLSLANAVFYLKQEKCESSFLERLKPAENLCQQNLIGTIKDYKVKSLHENEAIFEEVHRVISLVQEKISFSCTPTTLQHLNNIKAFYQTYIQRVCQATDKERSRLMKGKEVLRPQDLSLLRETFIQQDDRKIYALIGCPQQSFIESSLLSSQDYQAELIKAQEQQNWTMQVMFLEKTSDFYLSEGRRKTTTTPNDYVWAAYYLNSALAIVQNKKIHPWYESHLMHKVEILEKRAFQAFCQKDMPVHPQKDLKIRRKELYSLRNEIKNHVDRGDPIHPLLGETTEKFRQFLAHLIEESIQLIGPPKTTYAFISLGSMARHEMCPWSDLEFAILIEKSTRENKIYFRNLMHFLEIKIINMGETPVLIGKDPISPTPHGFCLDQGGNTPLSGAWELIGNPQQLAQYQKLNHFNDNPVTSNALTHVGLITGSEGRQHSDLYREYRSAVARELNATLDHSWFSIEDKEKVHHRKALLLLKGHLKEFELNLSVEKEKSRVFGVKKEIYRIIQSLIDALALFFNLEQLSTEKRIYEMIKKGIISSKGGHYLLRTIAIILMFRLKAQFFYQDGKKDYLYHPRLCQPQSAEEIRDLLLLTDEYIPLLEEVYQTLYPFYFSVKAFFELNASQSWNAKEDIQTCQRINSLKNITFHIDLTKLARVIHESLRTNLAEMVIHQAVALNPNNTSALELLIKIKLALGKQREAQQYIQECLLLLKTDTADDSTLIKTASTLNLLGKSFQLIHAFKKAQKLYNTSLETLEKILVKNKKYESILMDSFQGLGECCLAIRQFKEAKKFYYAADEIALDKNNEFDDNIFLKKRGDIQLCLGILHYEQGFLAQAQIHFQKASDHYLAISEIIESEASLGYTLATYNKLIKSTHLATLPLHDTVMMETWLAQNPSTKRRLDIYSQIYKEGNLLPLQADVNIDKKNFLDHQLREFDLQLCLVYFHKAKIKCDSSQAELAEGIHMLKEILQLYKSSKFVDKPQEAIINCYLVLAKAYCKSNNLIEALAYAQKAFHHANPIKLFSLIQSCLSIFVQLLLHESDPHPEILSEWAKKILLVLEEIEEEQGRHLVLPTLLQLHQLYREFYPTETTHYFRRALYLTLKYGIDEMDDILFDQILHQLCKQPNLNLIFNEVEKELQQNFLNHQFNLETGKRDHTKDVILKMREKQLKASQCVEQGSCIQQEIMHK